jgi:hypothetical protein
MNPYYVIGIDPGYSGGVSVFKDGVLINSFPLPYLKLKNTPPNSTPVKSNHKLNTTLFTQLLSPYTQPNHLVIIEKQREDRVIYELGYLMAHLHLLGFTNFRWEAPISINHFIFKVFIPEPELIEKYKGLLPSNAKKKAARLAVVDKQFGEGFMYTETSKRPHDGIADAILIGYKGTTIQ